MSLAKEFLHENLLVYVLIKKKIENGEITLFLVSNKTTIPIVVCPKIFQLVIIVDNMKNVHKNIIRL